MIVFTFPDTFCRVQARHGYCQKIGPWVCILCSAECSAACRRCPAAHLLELRAELRRAAIRPGSCSTDAEHLWCRKLGKHFSLLRLLCLHLAADAPGFSLPPLLRWSSLSPAPPNTTTTTSKTKPYCFIKPYFHNKSLSSACLCLSLAPGPQITANRGRNSEMAAYREQLPTSSPPHCF